MDKKLRSGRPGATTTKTLMRRAETERAELRTWGDAVLGFETASGVLFGAVEDHTALPRSSFELLQRLVEAPDHAAPINHLARTLIFSSGGMTKLSDRLTDAGLIERVPSPNDRRVINLTLTDAGVAAATESRRVYLDALQRTVIAKLGHDRYHQLVELLASLVVDNDACVPNDHQRNSDLIG